MSTAVEVLRNPVARHHPGEQVNALGGSVFDIAIAVSSFEQTGSAIAMDPRHGRESIPTFLDPDGAGHWCSTQTDD